MPVKEALQALASLRVLVVGDVMVDRYHFGLAERISPEAPVPVVKVRREEDRLGGAANVVNNLVALGCRVGVCGLIGSDAAGEALRTALEAKGVDSSALVADPARPTTLKLRVMAHDHQLLRMDWENTAPPSETAASALRKSLSAALNRYDGVIVSDYSKGVVSAEVLALLVASGKPVVVGPKGRDYSRYRGVTCITPNESEAALATGLTLGSEADALAAAGRLQTEVDCKSVCITRGAAGVLGVEGKAHRFIPTRAREVYDVTGAGDTFISVLGALLIAGRPFFESMEVANAAAGLVVGKVGTATVSPAELLDSSGMPRKIYGLDEIGSVARRLRAEGKRIVFTNGCFDLLHTGHIQYLQASRAEGDLLVVGLNSDASVRRLKGPKRPVIDEEDRAHLLAALACVDYVVIFPQDTPLELVEAVRPHVLTKGADYTVETVVGHEQVASWGGQVRLIALKENRSTSGLIQSIVKSHGKAN